MSNRRKYDEDIMLEDEYDEYGDVDRYDGFDWDTATEEEMEREFSRMEGNQDVHLMIERKIFDNDDLSNIFKW